MNNKRYRQFLRLLEVSQAMINRTLNKYVQQGADPEIARTYLDRYNKLNMSNRLSVDLQVVPFERLKQLVDNTETVKSKTQEKKDAVVKGSELVYQNDNWKIYRIDTIEASCKLGSMSKWCISRVGNEHFDNYKKFYNIYFVLNKNGLDDKYAVLVDAKGTLVVWDRDNEQINESVMFNSLGQQIKANGKKIFEPKDISTSECIRYIEGEYTINADGTIDVEGSVNLYDIDYLISIPFNFGKVTGDFVCCGCDITSLEGAPKFVGGDFDCSYCTILTSLEGAPKMVGGDFKCSNCNSLTSLKGAPESVGGDFKCSSCDLLTSLEGAPKVINGNFFTPYCKSLVSLKGAPKSVGEDFWCCGCKSLTSLQGAPESVGGNFDCSMCVSLASLQGAPKNVSGGFWCFGCKRQFTKKMVNKISNVEGQIEVSA